MEDRMRIFQVAVLAACIALPVVAQAGPVKVWETDADQSKLLAPQADVSFGKAKGTVITVDPAQTFQSMVGFGAAMTDASAYLIRNRMTDGQRDALMGDLFGPDGLGFSFMRLTIGASDFSRAHYSYDDMPAGQSDPAMAHFSIDSAKVDVIPAVKQALALNPKLTVMASPWSAPGWMKTTDSLIRGVFEAGSLSVFCRLSVALSERHAGGRRRYHAADLAE
jgi:glucosylceramidase